MHLIAHLIHEYGLIAVATIVALECLGFPVPGETALLGAAIDAETKHDLNIGTVITVAAGAAIVGRHLLGVRRRLAAFSRSACWTAHLSTSEFTRFCSSSLSFGDLGRGAGADLNGLLKFNPRKKSLSPSTIIKSSRACSRKRFVGSSFVSFG